MKIHKKSRYAPLRYEALNPDVVKSFVGVEELNPIDFDNDPSVYGPASTFFYFYRGGRIIYDVTGDLLNTLFESESFNIPCSVLQFPYPSFYIHFDGSNEVEGLYVHTLGRRLKLAIIHSRFGMMPIGLTLDDDKNITDVIEAELKNSVKYLNEDQQYFYEELMEISLPLLFNFLLYLMAQEEDVIYDWANDVPVERLERLSKVKKFALRATQERAMLSDGYRKVYHVGRKFSESYQLSLGSGGVRSPHYRKGHFRLQAHGKKMKLRKVIFIAPTFVNATGADDISTGKIIQIK